LPEIAGVVRFADDVGLERFRRLTSVGGIRQARLLDGSLAVAAVGLLVVIQVRADRELATVVVSSVMSLGLAPVIEQTATIR
jgi:hypothetical protein